MTLRKLNDSEDVLLMMEFRNLHWKQWKEFCKERGYMAEVDGDYNES